MLGDKETNYAQKLIRNATERGHEEFNRRLAAIDKAIRQFGGKGFLNEAKILQTARLIEQADKTGIKNLVPSNIWSPKSWLKFLTPKAGTQARYWAQAINSGKVAPENLTGRVNASILPFVGDTITQARALAAARFGVGSVPQEAVNIFGNELGRQAYKSPKAMRKAARKQYKKFQGDILDRDNLQGIRFGRHGIEEIISSSANTDKLNAVPAIPKIIKRGKLGAVRPLYKQRNDRYTGYQYIETPVNYKGKPSKAYVSIAHEQGKGPAFNNINIGQKDASPAIHHNGGAGEAINSITNKPAKNKAQFNVFDLLRVLNSPYYGGIAGGERPDFDAMRRQAAKLKGKGAAEKRLADIDTLELVYNSMTEAEREGFKAGAAKKLRTLAESSGAEYENLALKLFGLNRMRKLKAAGMDVSRIEPAVQREVHAARNMRNLLRGSQTAERGEDIGNMLTGPISYAKKFAAAKINQLTGIKPADIARIATDPGYAALMRLKAQAARGEIPFIEIGGRGGAAFGSITGPLTSKEKDLYRKQVRKNLMSNARGKTFYSKNGEGIKFNRAGIDKGMSATSKTDKLLMLDNAPKISSGAVPLPFEYIKDPYIKTMAAPVSADGRKDIALITLEAQKNKPAFFHNINPISYWAWKYGGFKKGIPSKSSWYQGKGQKNAPRFAHPAYKSGAMPKGTDNISNNGAMPKGTDNISNNRKKVNSLKMRDFAILLQRPLNLGYNGEIIFNNLKKREDN